MRSPWVGSLALLAPAHGFVAPSAVVRGSNPMLQAFMRPSAGVGGARALSSQAWRWQAQSLRLQQQQQLQRVAPRQKKSTTAQQVGSVRMMMAKGGGGGGGDGGGGAKGGNKPAKKKEKVKKPESYYKQTVILPQTGFEQVRELGWVSLCSADEAGCVYVDRAPPLLLYVCTWHMNMYQSLPTQAQYCSTSVSASDLSLGVLWRGNPPVYRRCPIYSR